MLLEITGISFGHNGKILINNASLSVNPGELVIIGGPSGSGKSSLLRLLNRLNDPDCGSIYFNDKPLTDHVVVELRRQIHYLQQTPLMIEGTVKQNLLLPFTFQSSQKISVPTDEDLLAFLSQFELTDIALLDSAINLSVGQKQRLAFIRALLLEPKILLLDEPTSALDPQSRAIVEEHIERLAREQGIAIILVTHLDFHLQHARARRFLLRNGNLKELSE